MCGIDNKVDMSVLIAIMLCRKELATPLWARARQAGAYTDTERRNFGIADNICASRPSVGIHGLHPILQAWQH